MAQLDGRVNREHVRENLPTIGPIFASNLIQEEDSYEGFQIQCWSEQNMKSDPPLILPVLKSLLNIRAG